MTRGLFCRLSPTLSVDSDVNDIIEEVGGKRKYKDDGPQTWVADLDRVCKAEVMLNRRGKKRKVTRTSRVSRLDGRVATRQRFRGLVQAARLASNFAGQTLEVDAKTDIFQRAMFCEHRVAEILAPCSPVSSQT